ncbi:uncharacterized protein EI97DRAFT_441166 [Westerdykella ornata]|uniref:Uncharacterized protein n=1 Tax=Westerdykella ornata TaxID=318751 RepID=A0A6A6JNQ3_WESOR|nr:uncharacterized protein EI97DRAFT_441166 [Westerdykella ornata]KAF2277875.1 hypothetical protein EI97DRAFT_441166 [Westerdykella ornata]
MEKIRAILQYEPTTSGLRNPLRGNVQPEADACKAERAPFSGVTASWTALLKYMTMADDQNLGIGSGLVEIAALTALIGGSTAESLALGTRGACGLPWAAMSCFGSMFTLKACVSACTPAWLRETIGVRTKGSDNAVGYGRRLDKKANGRRMTGEAMGVMVEWSKDKGTPKSQDCDAFEEVYAFDEWTAGPLRSCTVLEPGQHLQAHCYMRDPQWAPVHRFQIKADWFYTFLSLAKFVEMFLLYYYGSHHIYWITGLTWAYFFVSATILQLISLGRASHSSLQSKCIDIVQGKLPNPQVIGGERKVLFDVPTNHRKSRLWSTIWAMGSVICGCSLVATYAQLSKEPVVCFHIWLAFQVLWLSLRSIFFHFARRTDDMERIITPAVTGKQRPSQLSLRLLGLSVAISKHQVLNHPRGAYSYKEDADDPTIIRDYLARGDFEFLDHLQLAHDATPGSTVKLSIVCVIGDTLLSSVAWLMGSPLTGMDLYDCCILVLRSSDKTLLVPACRVLSGRVDYGNLDPELTVPSSFLPKGVSNDGTDISWRYWIPCGGDKWAYYSTPWAMPAKQGQGIVGEKEMQVTCGDRITEELMTGKLLVSFTSVKDVEGAVAQSAAAARILKNMLLDTTIDSSGY